MHFFAIALTLLGLSTLGFAHDNSTDSDNSPDTIKSSNNTDKVTPQHFEGGGGQPRYCKRDEKLCKYKKDDSWHDWNYRRDCCKPTEICRKDKGCVACPVVKKGPHGGLITDVDFGKYAKREVMYWLSKPEECCAACANKDDCSGWAWSVKKRKCYLSISKHCSPVEYRESKDWDDKHDHIFVVGGGACNDYKPKYEGYDYDWYKTKSQGQGQQGQGDSGEEPGVDQQSE